MKFNPNEIVFGVKTRNFKPNEYMCLYSIWNVAYEHKVIVLNLFSYLRFFKINYQYNTIIDVVISFMLEFEHEYSYKQCISLQHKKFINSPIASKNSIVM